MSVFMLTQFDNSFSLPFFLNDIILIDLFNMIKYLLSISAMYYLMYYLMRIAYCHSQRFNFERSDFVKKYTLSILMCYDETL